MTIPRPLRIGDLLAGRFRILREMGEGAVARVFLAEHEVLGRRYAIKVLKAQMEAQPTQVERFRREAMATSRLEHPSIIYVSDFGRTDDGHCYLVMEYIEGHTLREEMDRFESKLMPLRISIGILTQIGGALRAAHDAQVVHRDLKPDNVLLTPGPGGVPKAKILDFGIAKLLADVETGRITKTGEVFGTPNYMSPEQCSGKSVDEAADLYGFGVMAFELLAGRHPFLVDSIPQMLNAHLKVDAPAVASARPASEPPIPPVVADLVDRCLKKEPGERPLTATVADLLERSRDRLEQPRQPTHGLLELPGAAELVKKISGEHPAAAVPWDAAKLEPAAPENLWSDGSPETQWVDITQRAREIATSMKGKIGDGSELEEVLRDLTHMDQVVVLHDQKLKKLHDQHDKVAGDARDRETQLRYALVDLSLQRSRFADGSASQPGTMKDLDFQIHELEKRLDELFRQRDDELGRLEDELATIESAARKRLRLQKNRELDLLRLLRNAAMTEPELHQPYAQLEAQLAAFSASAH